MDINVYENNNFSNITLKSC